MSTSAIIFFPGVDHRTPPMGRFFYSQRHGKHIWEGKEYPLNTTDEVTDFNLALAKAMPSFPDKLARPMPLLLHTNEATAEDVPVADLVRLCSERKDEIKAFHLEKARESKARKHLEEARA